jgi:hypothetical protein
MLEPLLKTSDLGGGEFCILTKGFVIDSSTQCNDCCYII